MSKADPHLRSTEAPMQNAAKGKVLSDIIIESNCSAFKIKSKRIPNFHNRGKELWVPAWDGQEHISGICESWAIHIIACVSPLTVQLD